MDEVQHPESESEAELMRGFEALREEVAGLRPNEDRLRELDAILGRRPHAETFDEIRFDQTWDEVESHRSLPDEDPARQRAAAIVQELLDSSKLRQALLPLLMTEGPNVLRDWVYVWRYLEEERQTLLHASQQEASSRNA
jgi:hypothetical protein